MKQSSALRIALAAASLGGLALAQDGSLDTPPNSGGLAPTTRSNSLAASPGAAQVLFTSVTGHPTAVVPGYPSLVFANTSGHTAPFDRPFGSANGHYIIAADTNDVTTADDTLLVDGVVVEKEGNVASWATVAGSTLGPFQTRQGINASGEYVFKNNTSETSTADDYVVKVTSGPTYTVLAREALDIPQLPNTELWNDNLEGVLIAANGDVGFEANGIQNPVSTANDEIYVFGNNLLYQEGVTVPAGQAGGGTAPMEFLDFEDTWVSTDGLHLLYKGDVNNGATTADDVVVFDGNVVLQEGSIVPGSSYTNPIASGGVVEVAMDFGGHWYARGGNATTGDDWIVRDGAIIAKTGDPIIPSATELWDDATFADLFFLHQGDSNGNWVIGGVTDNANVLTNGVLVLNGTTVICRENDPIDLDGNGLFDDDAFFNTFGNDDAVLFDNGDFIFVASIRNAAGTAYAQGMFKIDTTPVSIVSYCTAGTSTNNCVPAISGSGVPSAAASSGFTISIANVEGQKQGLVFYGITGRNNATWGVGGTSFLCVKSPTQRMNGQNSGGSISACDGSLSQDWLAFVAAHPGCLGAPFAAGNTVQAQGWYRDPPAVKTTNLSDGLEFTLVP